MSASSSPEFAATPGPSTAAAAAAAAAVAAGTLRRTSQQPQAQLQEQPELDYAPKLQLRLRRCLVPEVPDRQQQRPQQLQRELEQRPQARLLQRPSAELGLPADSNDEESCGNRLKKDGRLRLKKRFRKRRSDSPLGSATQSRSSSSMSGRSVKFHRLFDIPTSEVLIRTFPCALKAEILLQGTFYVSANYFCFYARLANKRKTIKIPIRTVCEITREKTAIFFPNAIGIRTAECRYVFGSILSRETTVKLLLELWKTALNTVENGSQPITEQPVETVQRLFRSSSDSDLASLQSGADRLIVKPKSHQNGDCPAAVVAAAAAASASSHPHHSHGRHPHHHHRLRSAEAPGSPTRVGLASGMIQQQQQHTESYASAGDHSNGLATRQRSRKWSEFIMQFVLFLRSHLSFILADNRMAIGCSLIVFCLIYVLYLAYQIHIIQQTISERLEELLQSSAILSPLAQR